jgi:hypothetical protein
VSIVSVNGGHSAWHTSTCLLQHWVPRGQNPFKKSLQTDALSLTWN